MLVLATPGLSSALARFAQIGANPLMEAPDLISPPEDRTDWPRWRESLKDWREAKKSGYDDSLYRVPESRWSQTCFCCHKIMTWDASFLDRSTGKYKVEEYLENGRKVFGGFDAVVLWQAYPRIGFDDRNQFDYYRQLPGGFEGLADVVRRFHAQGVRVFIDYNPWDIGTRREPVSDEQAIADLVKTIDADGVFLDTMTKGNSSMRVSLDARKKGVAFETELPLALEAVPFNQLSWAQWLDKTEIPGVLRDHWFERRHMTHAIRRWDTDHTNEIQMAWMNGAGIMIWENIFGSWNPWSEENCETVRKMLPIQRHFSRHLLEGDWEPLIETSSPEVCCSSWKLGDAVLWTAVNTGDKASPSDWLPNFPGTNALIDLISGERVTVTASIPPRGIGALLSIPSAEIGPDLRKFLDERKAASREKIVADRHRTIEPITSHQAKPSRSLPAGMRAVAAGSYDLTSQFRERECGERGYSHYENQVYPGLHGDLKESHQLVTRGFAISEKDVSSREFQEFMDTTHYKPKIPDNFLHHMTALPAPDPEGPVVYVTREDAEAYARWKEGRLPSDLEWQLAMQSLNLNRGSFAVWNWTSSAFTDRQTQFVLLKGGSDYEAKGSVWYADGGRRGSQWVAKFIEIWPGLDRCGTIGFRYVVDLH